MKAMRERRRAKGLSELRLIVQTNALPAVRASVVVRQMTSELVDAPDFRVTIEARWGWAIRRIAHSG